MANPTKKRQNRHEQLILSAQLALGALLAYSVGFRFTALFPDYLPKIGGLWSAISVVVVIQATRRETTSSAFLRIVGSAIGALVSGLYLTLFKFSAIGLGLSVLITGLICTSLNRPNFSRLSAITVLVVMVTASLDSALNPMVNALLRLAESCIGSMIAFGVVVLWPQHWGHRSIEP
ncbi:MAG: FUSC family protein [Cyanobacteriota bacterium]|nr:FUSC family protein [Cyanobacteriota bacterium]